MQMERREHPLMRPGRNDLHCRTLLDWRVTGLLCVAGLQLAAAGVPPDPMAADVRERAAQETAIVEPGGTGSWEDMLEYEATHPPGDVEATPRDLPNMPPPEPREITGEPAGATPVAPLPGSTAPAAFDTPAHDFAPQGDSTAGVPPDPDLAGSQPIPVSVLGLLLGLGLLVLLIGGAYLVNQRRRRD